MRAGHSTNPVGRPRGRLDDTTIAARELLRASREKAAQVIAAGLDSPVAWERYGAAKTILDGVMPEDGDPAPVDAAWMEYLTDKELRLLGRMIERARERMPISEPPEDGDERDVIDVTPLPRSEPFSLSTLPAPGNAEPVPAPGNGQPEEPDLEEEFS
jgi:hypothetical protein